MDLLRFIFGILTTWRWHSWESFTYYLIWWWYKREKSLLEIHTQGFRISNIIYYCDKLGNYSNYNQLVWKEIIYWWNNINLFWKSNEHHMQFNLHLFGYEKINFSKYGWWKTYLNIIECKIKYKSNYEINNRSDLI